MAEMAEMAEVAEFGVEVEATALVATESSPIRLAPVVDGIEHRGEIVHVCPGRRVLRSREENVVHLWHA